jgi:hypothetical protein
MKRKRKLIRTPQQIKDGEISYHLPFLQIVRRKGFYWIHENTVKEYDPFNEGIFNLLLESHNLIITEVNNQLKIFKITKNAACYN